MTASIPDDRLFSAEHEWLKLEVDSALMGISDHAQHALGDVVYVELPAVGREISRGLAIGVVESVKAVSDIYAPVSGVITAINHEVLEHPDLINKDPYGQGWLLKIALKNSSESLKYLLSAYDYRDLLTKEAK